MNKNSLFAIDRLSEAEAQRFLRGTWDSKTTKDRPTHDARGRRILEWDEYGPVVVVKKIGGTR